MWKTFNVSSTCTLDGTEVSIIKIYLVTLEILTELRAAHIIHRKVLFDHHSEEEMKSQMECIVPNVAPLLALKIGWFRQTLAASMHYNVYNHCWPTKSLLFTSVPIVSKKFVVVSYTSMLFVNSIVNVTVMVTVLVKLDLDTPLSFNHSKHSRGV